MFFKNERENVGSFTNSLFDLFGKAGGRYLNFFKEAWAKDRKQTSLLLVSLVILFVVSLWICSIAFSTNASYISETPRQNIENNQPSFIYTSSTNEGLVIEPLVFTEYEDTEFELLQADENEPIGGAVGDQTYKTIEVLKGMVQGFKPMLDAFVSNTPDVSGVSTNEISFSSGKFPTAREFSNRLLSLVIPIYIIFLAIEGFILIKNANSGKGGNLNQILWRSIFFIFMLVFTPFILSYSIQGVNAFCEYILGGKDLTTFLTEFLSKFQEGYRQAGDTDNGLISGIQAISNPTGTFIEIFQAVIAMIPIFLITILYLLVLGQFIIRFIKLYFLAAIYPLVIVFYGSPMDQNYTRNYWSSWTRTLLHQAFFVFGYAIIQTFLLQMLQGGGVGAEQIAIFIGMLLFLYNINGLTSEIVGGAITRGGNAINSVLGSMTGGVMGAVGLAGVVGGRSLAMAGAGNSGQGFDMSKGTIGSDGAKSGGFQGFSGAGKGKSSNQTSTQRTTPSGNTRLSDPTQSKQAQSLAKQNYAVGAVDPNEGIIGVEGSFYAHDQKGGYTALYNSREDAIEDRVPVNEIYQTNGQFNVQDTTNYAGRETYEQRTGSELGVNAKDTQIKDNLNQAKYDNRDKGVDGITTTQVSKNRMARMKQANEKITDATPRINKTVVYTDKVNKSNN
jgi:hypothetical protein